MLNDPRKSIQLIVQIYYSPTNYSRAVIWIEDILQVYYIYENHSLYGNFLKIKEGIMYWNCTNTGRKYLYYMNKIVEMLGWIYAELHGDPFGLPSRWSKIVEKGQKIYP